MTDAGPGRTRPRLAISLLAMVTLVSTIDGRAQQPLAPVGQAAPAGQPPPAGFGAPPFAPAPPRPRVIVTTDGEIDDRDSMIRFLLYANEFDVEALIYNSSRFHWLGNAWAGTEWISDEIDMYSRVYPFLRQHADNYPTAEFLRSRTYVGNITHVSEMEQDTPGADRIVSVLLDDRPGPVYLQAWGGTNTIAKALSTIQKQHREQMDRVSQKAVLFIILDQDDTFRKYIEPNWPRLQVLGSFRQFSVLAFGWRNQIPPAYRPFFERPWLEGHISNGHGVLAGAYQSQDGAFRSEGDSPSFMHQIDVGLRSLEHPSYGGWGGRFVEEKPGQTNIWKDADDDGSVGKPIWRWAEAFQSDFAARADWCVKPYAEANHPPVVWLTTPANVDAAPGAVVKVDVSESADADGDRLAFHWWQYKDAGKYKGDVIINNAERGAASITIPTEAKPGDTIHLIADVTDGGKPPLTRYARVIIAVTPAARQEGK